MKKLKLFISLWFTMFSMVVFGQAEYEKIAITANTQDNSALKVSVQSSSNEINWKYIKDFQKEKEYLSTGLIKSGVISINGDNTKYNVSAGIGIITNFDDPENPTSTIVNFPAVVAKTPSYLTTSNITYVAINSSGTVTESATPFTPEQRRTLIILGAVIHSNLTNINVVNNISAPTNASTNQLHDLMEAIGALNLSGNKFGPNNANLLMNKSAGTIFKLGSNFVNDWKNPHVLGQGALTGLTFRYRTQNGTEGADVTSINPNVYDLNNVLTAVPSNRYSIQTITLFQSGLVRVQYGQETYGSLSEAEAAISTRSYAVESNIALNGITRAYLLVKEGSTSLTNTANAKFVDAGKFGSITSGGGAITLASIIAALGYTPENDANKQNSLATDGSGVKYPTVDAVNTKVSNIDNTSDLNKPISTATQTALNLKENTANKNIANGYAGLGSDGKLISSQLPSITITDTFVVGSQSAMLSLVAETGDVAVRTDVNKSFILQGDTPSDLADWQELLTPTSTVSSVFGRIGAVTSNVGDYTADQISETASRKFQTLAQQTYNDATSSIQTQLNGKQATLTNPITGSTLLSGNAGTGYVPRATASTTLTNSNIFDNGTNVGIGTTSPTLGKLQVVKSESGSAPSAVLRLENTGVNYTSKLILTDGTTNDANISYLGATQSLGFGLGTSLNQMVLTLSGNVGIGTTNPATKLHIQDTNGGIFFDGSGATYNRFKSTTSSASVGRDLLFSTQNSGTTPDLYITSGGNVGIGTTSPNGALGIENPNSTSITYQRTGVSAKKWGFVSDNSATYWSNMTDGTLPFALTNGGNVGIGTTSPSSKLQSSGSDSGIFSALALENLISTNPVSGNGVGIDFRINNSGNPSYVAGKISLVNTFYRSNTDMTFSVANADTLSERMRITSGGNVGIGESNPYNGKLVIKYSSASTDALVFNNTNTNGKTWYFGDGAGTAAGNFGLYDVAATSLRFSIASTGAATFASSVTATAFFQSSDLRLKDIISRDGDVIKYKWKDKRDDKIHIGYVAQEVQKENPDQVNTDGKGILSVNYIEILVEKIRKLEKEIELLKAK